MTTAAEDSARALILSTLGLTRAYTYSLACLMAAARVLMAVTVAYPVMGMPMLSSSSPSDAAHVAVESRPST